MNWMDYGKTVKIVTWRQIPSKAAKMNLIFLSKQNLKINENDEKQVIDGGQPVRKGWTNQKWQKKTPNSKGDINNTMEKLMAWHWQDGEE